MPYMEFFPMHLYIVHLKKKYKGCFKIFIVLNCQFYRKVCFSSEIAIPFNRYSELAYSIKVEYLPNKKKTNHKTNTTGQL